MTTEYGYCTWCQEPVRLRWVPSDDHKEGFWVITGHACHDNGKACLPAEGAKEAFEKLQARRSKRSAPSTTNTAMITKKPKSVQGSLFPPIHYYQT